MEEWQKLLEDYEEALEAEKLMEVQNTDMIRVLLLGIQDAKDHLQ
jgi:hypothetical protein